MRRNTSQNNRVRSSSRSGVNNVITESKSYERPKVNLYKKIETVEKRSDK